mmetsp:Transcript_23347/g.74445  ORF Transcript_23347/g.74445 Transcript_23347/m.74445 type:complete len:503 (+) Transcript_23347:62-1570(+)
MAAAAGGSGDGMHGLLADMPWFRQEGWHAPRGLNYLGLGLGFLLVEQAFEVYLNLRQRQYLARDRLPRELEEQVRAIDDGADRDVAPAVQDMRREHGGQTAQPESLLGQLRERFTRSQTYNLAKNTFSFFSIGYTVVTSAAILLSGLNVFMWTRSRDFCANNMGWDPSNELAVGSVFLVAQSTLGTLINLPISLYNTFVLEAKHGFNKTTPQTFVTDVIKTIFVENILLVPLMAGIVKLVRWGGSQFWIYVWMLVFGFSLSMLTIYPNLIAPLFNTYNPLPEGKLKSEIEKLASSLEFPLTKLYEVDGSKRSSHSNAYLFGFWKDKRIVLFDTLIRNPEEPSLECTTEEIVGILGHELGHWKLSHTIKGFVVQNILYAAIFKGFGYFLNDPNMYLSFGFNDSEMPVVIGLNFFSYIISPLAAAVGLMLNSLTRKLEFEADAFAVQLGKARELKSGLTKIYLSNLASYDVDPLYQMFHHSHPSLLERLRFMDEEATRVDKKRL